MGMGNELGARPALLFDCETAPIVGAADYLETPEAPSNYVKPEVIANYILKAKAELLDRAALDIDLARVVALGALKEGDEEPTIYLCQGEDEERLALEWFWAQLRPYPFPRLVGFNILGYDLPLLLRRSLYLGIKTPPLKIGRFKHDDIDDLMALLNFDDPRKSHKLSFYGKRFGISVPDPVTGADIGRLVAEGNWAAVEGHVRADVEQTARLAARMGLFTRAVAL